MGAKSNINPSLAKWSLLGLVFGFGTGLAGHFIWTGPIGSLANLLAPLGTVWINALQMTVIPLVLTLLLAALVKAGKPPPIGRLGLKTFALTFSMLVGFGSITLLAFPHFLDLFTFPAYFAESIRGIATPEGAIQSGASFDRGTSGWLAGLVPSNAFEAAVRGDIIQLLLFTLLIGLAAGRLPEERRNPLAAIFQSLADTMMILVGWVLWLTPIGVFSVMLGFSIHAGIGVVGVSVLYVGLLCGGMVLLLIALYPITALWGGVSLWAFAKAAFPAQVVAAGTQSSTATLPALIEEGKNRLQLPEEITGFVLPLCASTFKLNYVVSQGIKLLFFARVFGVPIGMGTAFTFLFGVILISFASVGVPRGGGGFRTLPLHLAAGIPIEAIVLHEAVKTIPDVFYTIVNSTSYLSVATILRGKKHDQGSRQG